MTDKEVAPVTTEVGSPPPQAATPKKAVGRPKSANPKSGKATHPSTVQMIHEAVTTLKERGGSSLQAIKKYIAGTYKLDTERMAPFIKKHIKAAVIAGTLVQTKGKGASGSFKLPVGKPEKTKKAAKKLVAKKTDSPKKPGRKPASAKKGETAAKTTKKVTPKKQAKKPATAEKAKKASPKTVAKAATQKSPSRVKKITKAPTTKPKAPKPKKITAPKTTTKRVAASKK